MMDNQRCKDCIHFEVCNGIFSVLADFAETHGCDKYKNKDCFYELAIPIGTEVYELVPRSNFDGGWHYIICPRSFTINLIHKLGKTIFTTYGGALTAKTKRERR